MEAREINEILAASTDASAAIRALYHSRKQARGKVSLAWICARAGIPSKGYLSDVLSGRRKLNLSYRESLGAALGLTGPQARYFRRLVELDHEQDPARRQRLLRTLETLRRSFEVVAEPAPAEIAREPFVLEAFCAVALFGGEATIDDLASYFGTKSRPRLRRALDILMAHGHLKLTQERYAFSEQKVGFIGSDDPTALAQFLRGSILDAAHKVDDWCHRREHAHFESTVISVKRAEYAGILERLRGEILQWQVEMDAPNADSLIRFNVQIYPLDDPSTA